MFRFFHLRIALTMVNLLTYTLYRYYMLFYFTVNIMGIKSDHKKQYLLSGTNHSISDRNGALRREAHRLLIRIIRTRSMKYFFESIPDLPLNILNIQPHVDFFLLVFTGVFPCKFLPAFFHTLLFDVWYRVIDHFRAHSPEFHNMLLVRCLCPDIFHLGYLLFEIIVRICHGYPSVSLLLSKEVKSSLFI